MQPSSDLSDQAREHSGLPLSTDPWEPRGGSVWVATGLCVLALAVVFHLELDPAAARARSGADSAKQQAASIEREASEPETPAPVAAEAELDDHAGSEPAMQPANAEAPAGTSEQSAKPVRNSKRASAELRRTRRASTLTLDLGSPPAQEATTPVESPAPPTLGAQAGAALEEVAAPPTPARPSSIPDNPY